MRIGLILGGGGEVGSAWELGVLAALERDAGFIARDSHVIVGTSAGAGVGTRVALGRDLQAELAAELAGQGGVLPVQIERTDDRGAANGHDSSVTAAVPPDIGALLLSTEGELTQRNQAIGQLALRATVRVDAAGFVDVYRRFAGTSWPTVDMRPTSVSARTGKTVLWTADSGAEFAAAVASSSAVPGFLPPIRIGDDYYIDAPRQSYSAQLVAEENLDAVIFIGLSLPILANTDEVKRLEELRATRGLRLVSITGGARVDTVTGELMDRAARPRAAEIGFEDGAAAAPAVRELLAPA